MDKRIEQPGSQNEFEHISNKVPVLKSSSRVIVPSTRNQNRNKLIEAFENRKNHHQSSQEPENQIEETRNRTEEIINNITCFRTHQKKRVAFTVLEEDFFSPQNKPLEAISLNQEGTPEEIEEREELLKLSNLLNEAFIPESKTIQKTFQETLVELFSVFNNYTNKKENRNKNKDLLVSKIQTPTVEEIQWSQEKENKQLLEYCFQSFYQFWLNNPHLIPQKLFQENPLVTELNLPKLDPLILKSLDYFIAKVLLEDGNQHFSLFNIKHHPENVRKEDLQKSIQNIQKHLNKYQTPKRRKDPLYLHVLELKNLNIKIEQLMLSSIHSTSLHLSEQFQIIAQQSRSRFSNFQKIQEISLYLQKCDNLEEAFALISEMLLLLTVYLGPDVLVQYMQEN